MWQDFFARLVEASFEEAKKKNKQTSLRGFAKKLETAPGMVSEIMRGRRHVSWDRACRIAEKAEFSPLDRERLDKLYKVGEIKRPRKILKDEAVELILNPTYYRVLCAFEIIPAPVTFECLSQFLEISQDEINKVISHLQTLSVVGVQGNEITWNGQHVSTPADIASQDVQNFFRTNLADAANNLSLPPSEREYTTITFAGNISEMSEAKKKIRQFREQLSDSMQVEPNQIFQLSIQLSPVSKVFTKGPR